MKTANCYVTRMWLRRTRSRRCKQTSSDEDLW